MKENYSPERQKQLLEICKERDEKRGLNFLEKLYIVFQLFGTANISDGNPEDIEHSGHMITLDHTTIISTHADEQKLAGQDSAETI